MSFRPRDDFEETKSNLVYLDLSDLLLFTRDELEKTLSRIPDLRLKSDPLEESLIHNSNSDLLKSKKRLSHKQVVKHSVVNSASGCLSKGRLSSGSCSSESNSKSCDVYINPIPKSMIDLNLNDFCDTEIDWKMLTLSRPQTKLEEDYFSKLVELYQLRHKTRIEDGYGFRKAVFRLTRHPRVMQYKPVSLPFDSFGFKGNENTKNIHIKEDISYEAYTRVPIETGVHQFNDQSLAAAAELLSSGKSLDLKIFSDEKFGNY